MARRLHRQRAGWQRACAFALLCSAAACGSAPAPPPPAHPPVTHEKAHAAPSAAATPCPPAPSSAASPKTSGEAFLTSFLVEDDLPGLRAMHEPFASLGNDAFRAAGGELAGNAEWVDPHGNDVIWRVYDGRWTFHREADARRFVKEEAARAIARGGGGVIDEAPPIGQDCVVVGSKGDSSYYAYVFRVGRVVASVAVLRGPRAAEGSLKPTVAAALAEKATLRIALLAP